MPRIHAIVKKNYRKWQNKSVHEIEEEDDEYDSEYCIDGLVVDALNDKEN